MYHIRSLCHTEASKHIPFKTDPSGLWLECRHHNDIVAIFQLQEFSKICVNLHLHIIDKHQGKRICKDIYDPLIKWIKTNTQYTKLIGTVAEDNLRMRAIVSRLPVRIAGIISDGIIYNDRLQHLLIFESNIG